MALTKVEKRIRIKRRVRGKVSGTQASPRLSVFKSNKEIYAQLIDDKDGKTLVAASSREKGVDAKGTKVEVAAEGTLLHVAVADADPGHDLVQLLGIS